MSATKNKRAVIVGIFILVGVALLFAIILLLGGQKKTFAHTIIVKAIFDDVSGLQQGNNIWVAGVKVGTVKEIAFNANAKVEVSMNILSSMQAYIHKDAKAKIGSESLIGNKIIVLSEGTPQTPLIQSGDVLGVENTLNTEDIMNTLQQNNKNLLAITTNIKDISDQLMAGQGTIGKLLHDETLANTLQQTLNTLRTAAGNAQQFSSNLNNYTAKLQTPGSLTNDLVTDTVVFSRLRHTVTLLQQDAQSIQTVVSKIDNTASNLNSTNTPVGVLLNDPKAASDLKATLNNLNQGSVKLNDDLEALQHNFLFRGFFKKKEKEKTDTIHK